jgi:hypothetical protein
MNRLFRVVVILLILATVTVLWADEFNDALKQAEKYYSQGKYSQVINELNYALSLVNNKLAEKYKVLIPDAINNWEANEIEMQFAGLALAGGGVSLSRHYYQQNSEATVDIEMISNSPLLSTILMMFSNPLFLGGNKIVTVNGERAIEEWNANEQNGSLSFVLENTMLITINGSSLESSKTLHEFAQKIDFIKLRGLIKE